MNFVQVTTPTILGQALFRSINIYPVPFMENVVLKPSPLADENEERLECILMKIAEHRMTVVH